MRSELTIAMIPSSTCAAERRDACAISPSAKKTVCLNQAGTIVMNGRIVIMDMGLATRLMGSAGRRGFDGLYTNCERT